MWVPGCATGEEAYSLAILILEEFERAGKAPELQCFATDLDEAAIGHARKAMYSKSIEADVTDARLEQYFTLDGEHYCVAKRVRDRCIFAVQNLLTDPPFSKLSIVSCRNLMIYVEPDVQQQMLRMFSFALGGEGHLFLGSSESLGRSRSRFVPVSGKWRIYRAKPAPDADLQSPLSLADLAPPGGGGLTGGQRQAALFPPPSWRGRPSWTDSHRPPC